MKNPRVLIGFQGVRGSQGGPGKREHGGAPVWFLGPTHGGGRLTGPRGAQANENMGVVPWVDGKRPWTVGVALIELCSSL